jgi:hypothetical protein
MASFGQVGSQAAQFTQSSLILTAKSDAPRSRPWPGQERPERLQAGR